ncbi:MAG: HlyC/CorC family transporter [Firmicutes bacterium]|nr:HlyC/CorC family transporter [Bacillota bacterium]
MEGHLGRQLLIVLLLILVNAFFAAAEIALISLNDAKVRHEAEDGDRKARRLLKLVDNPTQFLSTIQIAITLAGFLASAFAADTFSDRLVDWLIGVRGWNADPHLLNTLSLILITLILSYFTLVLGELVPKRIAMAKAEKVTDLTAGTVLAAGVIFRPFVWLLTVSTNGLLRLFHIDPNDNAEQVSEEEIRLMVDIGEEKGAIETAEKEMIENIFEFNNITAEDVMVHRKDMVVVWLDDTDAEIMERICESGLSRFPVIGEDVDDVRGVLRTREYLINAQSADPKPLLSLIAPAFLVPETVAADDLFRDMQARKEHMAIVVDEYGGTSGLVTMEDLLEEIVGNIYDEFDQEEETVLQELKDGWWRASGSCEIEQLRDVVGLSLPEDGEEEFDTLGGLIFSCMNEIPADGSKPELTAYGLEIKVEEIADRRVEWARVRRVLQPEPEEE